MKWNDNLDRAQEAAALSPLGSSGPAALPSAESIELSIVIPCLNEADTIGLCVRSAACAAAEAEIFAEIIVADNGSTDGSRDIALQEGARVIDVESKGYGNALMGGISAARGKYVLMGDADASYDFAEAPKFVMLLRQGCALVQGCRLPSGGGRVMPGAMPFLHRWFGNPIFSWIVRHMFRAPIHDVNSGMRAFTKNLYDRLNQRCTGMEFAVEMVLKASLAGERIGEVPITLHRDGRQNRAPHLRTFHDGWRTLRFLLMCSPRWLFLYPGILLMLAGAVGYVLALPGLVIRGVGFDVHTLLLAGLSVVVGFQAIVFSVSAKTFAMTEGILPADPRFVRLYRFFTLERGLMFGGTIGICGLALIAVAFNEWRVVQFGALDYRHTLRLVLPGVLLLTLGVQAVFASFFLSILGLRRT